MQRAALFSKFLALKDWRAEIAADNRVAIRRYREQAAARSKERESSAELLGSRRLASLTNGRAQTIRFPIAPDRCSPMEGSCAAETSVVGLVASAGGGRD